MKHQKDDDNDRVDDLRPEAASWRSVLLVCKVCRKRSSGPRHVKTSRVVAEAKRLLRASRPRPRVLTTACLGLCPKKAVAVAMVGGESGGAWIVRVESIRQMERLLPLMTEKVVADEATVEKLLTVKAPTGD